MNKKILTDILYVVLFLIIFMLLQTLCVVLFTPFHMSLANTLILTSAVSSLVTIAVFVRLDWARIGLSYIHTRPVRLLLLTALLSLSLILPLQYLEEMMALNMPEAFSNTFQSIIGHPLGYLVIGILAPITEELVFRGAILRRLLSMGCHTWVAIAVSAVLFGAVHGNWAQFTHAFLLGLLLGWLYAKTRSIIPALVIHWVNNTVAFLLIRLFPTHADDNMLQLFANRTFPLFLSVVFSVLVALWSLRRISLSLNKK